MASSVLSWTTDDVARWLNSIGMSAYEPLFTDNDISGDVLIHLHHDALRDLSVDSLGHRLQILKAVYGLKIAHGIEFDDDDFRPLNEDGESSRKVAVNGSANDMVKQLVDEVNRLNKELGKLKEELGPLVAHVRSNPISPVDARQAKVQRRPSQIITKYLGGGGNTLHQPGIASGGPGSIKSARSPLGWKLRANTRSPSSDSKVPFFSGPTSPSVQGMEAMAASGLSSGGVHMPAPYFAHRHPSVGSLESRPPTLDSAIGGHELSPALSATGAMKSPNAVSMMSDMPSPAPIGPIRVYGDRLPGREGESFKTMRITGEDSCQRVVELTLKKYDIAETWKNYSLLIVHGSRERYVDYTEKPLSFYQRLYAAGEQPMFVLRHNRNMKPRLPSRAYPNTPSVPTNPINAAGMMAFADSNGTAVHIPVPQYAYQTSMSHSNPVYMQNGVGASQHGGIPTAPPRRTSSLSGGRVSPKPGSRKSMDLDGMKLPPIAGSPAPPPDRSPAVGPNRNATGTGSPLSHVAGGGGAGPPHSSGSASGGGGILDDIIRPFR